MKLSAWVKKAGVSYRTSWRWFKEGTLPVIAEQTKTGTILIKEEPLEEIGVVIYARVSSHNQKNNLDGQVARLASFASGQGWIVIQTITEN